MRPLFLLLLSALAAAAITTAAAAAAAPATLWEAISTNSSFSVLAGCVRLADDAGLLALLNDSSAACTLFAPLDSAFESNDEDSPPPCQDGNATEAALVVRYWTSTQATPLPYLNQPFPTLLPGGADDGTSSSSAQCLYAYSISKDAATPPELPPILYVDQARALGWEAIGPQQHQYLVPLATPLARPSGANGSVWDVIQARKELGTLASLVAQGLPELAAEWAALPDVAARKGYRTLFAPNDAAWAALPADRLARLQSDPQALRTLLAFHTLSNAQGDYPRSTTGMYYSQQFFPTTSPQARDVYRQFYAALQQGYQGLRLPNDLGILLEIGRANASDTAPGPLQLAGGAATVVTPDVGAFNGVVHILDAVAPLPEPILGVLAAPPQPLAAAGNFTALAQVLAAAGEEVAGQLATGGPFTLLAPTDAAFTAAVAAGLLPPVPALLRDAARCASLVQYWTVNASATGLLLFRPDPYHDPFQDDFPEGFRLTDASDATDGSGGRPLFVHRLRVQQQQQQQQQQAMGEGEAVNATAVFVNGARLYQCADGAGWGPACARTRQPSNTYAINDDRVVNMVHALDAVPLPPDGSLLELVQGDPDLSAFAALLARAAAAGADGGLTAALAGGGGGGNATAAVHTLFAPSNDALASLLAARPWLVVGTGTDGGPLVDVEVLRYHLVPGQLWYARWLVGAADAPPRLPTAAFGGAALVAVRATAGGNDTDGGGSSSAPPRLEVNRLAALATDVAATNGVLHKLDGALVPDLLQVAFAAGGLGTTVAALEGVGGAALLDTLTGPGPLTLLAPTDAAWAEAAEEDAQGEVTPAQLRYHVGAMAVWPENVTAAGSGALHPFPLPSLAGAPVHLTHLPLAAQHPYARAPEGGLFANQAALRLPGLRALNGVVYALDAVLQPPQASLLELLAAGDPEGGGGGGGQEGQTSFARLLEQAGLAAALNGTGSRASALLNGDDEDEDEAAWTVFAPLSRVLDGVYRGADIWADAQQLPELLGFHLVPGRRLFTPAFADAPCAPSAEGFCWGPPGLLVSLQGQALAAQVAARNETYISAEQGAFTARVVRANVHARNGVLHWVEGICTYEGFRRPA